MAKAGVYRLVYFGRKLTTHASKSLHCTTEEIIIISKKRSKVKSNSKVKLLNKP